MNNAQYKELKDLVEQNAADMKEVKTFLVGQPEFEQHGLIHRVGKIEEHVAKHKKKQVKAEGIRAVLAVIAGFIAGNIKAAWELITS